MVCSNLVTEEKLTRTVGCLETWPERKDEKRMGLVS